MTWLATATLTKAVLRLRRTVFLFGRGRIAGPERVSLASAVGLPGSPLPYRIIRLVRGHFSDQINCISFVLSPRACSSLKSAANCSSSNFIRADAPQWLPSSGPRRQTRQSGNTIPMVGLGSRSLCFGFSGASGRRTNQHSEAISDLLGAEADSRRRITGKTSHLPA